MPKRTLQELLAPRGENETERQYLLRQNAAGIVGNYKLIEASKSHPAVDYESVWNRLNALLDERNTLMMLDDEALFNTVLRPLYGLRRRKSPSNGDQK